MPRPKECSFCGELFEPGTGMIFVRTSDATVFNFCSSKCRKNFDLGRNPIRVRWTKRFRAFREEMAGKHAAKAAPKAEKPKAEKPKDETPERKAGPKHEPKAEKPEHKAKPKTEKK